MSKTIKLLDLGDVLNGVKRLQSQLLVGTGAADYILEDGTLKNWGCKNGNFDYHETSVEYEIFQNPNEMLSQML